ncbi:MAG: hypothetical protein MUF45_09375 [Spirosomaceae bacterium]|jgi:hypothetical protein|nr:hypothetical protein [Spirosomataceae bacterium]
MIQKTYQCILHSDVVLNSKLATEGNMETLESIPGSNFLGLVAHAIYKEYSKEEAYKLLHSNKVLFGDAHISDGENISYAMPFSLFKAKVETEETKDTFWVQFAWDKTIETYFKKNGIQPKQNRSGFLNENGVIFDKIQKNFALKSAQDRKTRASEDGKMFGVSSLEKGQIFVFSIYYESEDLIELVEKNLTGYKFIGKSKSAQFGKVQILPLSQSTFPASKTTQVIQNENNVIVYAESNLCFLNEFGHPTYQPTAQDLGFSSGEINWEKSQIRTYSYSPWNLTRNTPNTQRHCILKGSIIFVENGQIDTTKKGLVGEYLNEGLGRVLYNPTFLKADTNAVWQFQKIAIADRVNHEDNPLSTEGTALVNFLIKKRTEKEKAEIEAQAIHAAVHADPHKNSLKDISPSQWGQIREKATSLENIEALKNDLFNEQTGFLYKGVSADKYWNKHQNREKFKSIFDVLKNHGMVAIAKYAGEIAKKASKNKEK